MTAMVEGKGGQAKAEVVRQRPQIPALVRRCTRQQLCKIAQDPVHPKVVLS